VLGALFPSVSHQVFSQDVLPFIEVVAQIGLIFFMFLIGLELDVRLIRGRGQAATTVSHVSIIGPFLLGAAVFLVAAVVVAIRVRPRAAAAPAVPPAAG